MRVAILAWDLPPTGSGLGRAAIEIARGLAQLGCDVTLFDAGRAKGTTDDPSGVSIIGCRPPQAGLAGFLRKRATIGHVVAPWYFHRAVKHAHQASPFDVIEATNWYAPAACLTFGTPPLIVRNSTPAIAGKGVNGGVRNGVDLWFAHQLEKWTTRHADALISNTVAHAEVIRDLYSIHDHQIHKVIPLALDLCVMKRGAAAALPSTTNIPSLLFVGRAERRKGFKEMLAGYAAVNIGRVAAGNTPIRLTIIGVKSSFVISCLSEENGNTDLFEHVTVLNGLSDEELYSSYEQATAVIAPSRYESFGLVYREAAAFGRPLIACAEDPAAKDFIRDAQCGMLAQSCTPAAISDAIEQFLGAPYLWQEFATAGRQHVRKLTTENLAQETLEVYKSVISLRENRN